jgi:hypothetical protein
MLRGQEKQFVFWKPCNQGHDFTIIMIKSFIVTMNPRYECGKVMNQQRETGGCCIDRSKIRIDM